MLPLVRPITGVWSLRDFHVDNLFWLPERSGINRVGLIDTQDAVIGHPAYDLVSILQDARVDVAEETARELLDLYCAARAAADPSFDDPAFRTAYVILGVQRAAKILGIFSRLSLRDMKHGYLRHLPRVRRQLDRGLAHPALGELRAWFERHLPRPAVGSGAPS